MHHSYSASVRASNLDWTARLRREVNQDGMQELEVRGGEEEREFASKALREDRMDAASCSLAASCRVSWWTVADSSAALAAPCSSCRGDKAREIFQCCSDCHMEAPPHTSCWPFYFSTDRQSIR